MLSRKQLSQRYNLSLATVRRLLQLLSIQPSLIQQNQKGLPVFYYNDQITQKLDKHILEAAQYKKLKKRTCSICGQKFSQQLMIGTRCCDCYVDKCCKPILFGKQPWKCIYNNKLVDKAIDYLRRFKQSTK